jgi:hypothetical protein
MGGGTSGGFIIPAVKLPLLCEAEVVSVPDPSESWVISLSLLLSLLLLLLLKSSGPGSKV